MEGTKYFDGIFTWNVNLQGRITGIAPKIGFPPLLGKGFRGGKVKMGHPKGKMPGDHTRQNKQVETLAKKYGLDKKQIEVVHREIGGQGYGYHEIEELIIELFK